MKTKHLLFATALVASLAACTNDDFTIDKQQNVANDGRPTVSDVKLNFVGDGADTRLAFGKDGYAWEANDTIGALLMDKVNTLDASKTWLEKYTLTEYIHTSYPFTYSTADKTWSCNTKMLEGNYFFAFPWESYDGNRQVRHSLIKQEQKGVKGNVVAESYAKNQFFIGYAQIKAGTVAKDALTDVEMTSLLGAVQLRIVNTGTQTYHINKIVLRGNGIKSELTFDPTSAEYAEYNLRGRNGVSGKYEDGTEIFNYANYTGNQTDLYEAEKDYVFNADGEYDRMAALRAVVNASGEAANAQLIITGTPEERALVSTKDDAKAMAYALIMANAHEPNGDLKLDIYTDEGLVSGIDLTEINTATDNTYKAIADSKVEEISPEVANTIKVQIDDNSFAIPDKMDVYDNDDLLQFIEWNAKVTGVRTAKATLYKDVTLTKEMMDALTKNKNLSLTISGSEKLTIAEGVAANVLENEKLTISTDIEVLGTISLTAKSNKFEENITIAEGGTVNVDVDGVDLTGDIENNGTLNIGEGVTLKNGGGTITNKAIMNVAKLADVKTAVTNKAEATVNIDGFMIGLTNEEDAEVVMGEGANLAGVTNEGVIRTAKNAIVAGTNDGEIVYVEDAKISTSGGIISYEAAGKSFGKDAFKDNKVNKLILKRGETKITDDLKITNIVIAEDGVVLKVADKKTLTVDGKLTVEGSVTTEGTIKATNVAVEKKATLTNNGTITASEDFGNKGVVANNGKVYVPEDKVEGLNDTNWEYNDAEKIGDVTPPAVVEPISVTIKADGDVNQGEYASVEALYNAVNTEVDAIEIKDITITVTIDMSGESSIEKDDEGNFYSNGELLKSLADGKKVTLNGSGIELQNLTSGLGLKFKELVVSQAAEINGTPKNMVVLTVDKVDADDAALTVKDVFLQVNDSKAQSGFGSAVISGTITGTVVNSDGTLKWNGTTAKWEVMGGI
ncbi:MAG: hypothetical protein LUF04_01055 [Bacteroides sp.]|nr:hypothetical protein [Bacteroides sp.]